MALQSTINKEIKLEGIGIHTGKKASVILKPAEENSGIVFIRTDLPDKPKIPVSIDNLLDSVKSPRRTSLGIDGVEIHTIEHLMATLSALEIDNLIIEVKCPELPGLDGSADGFIKAIKESGIKQQDKPRDEFQVRETIFIEEKDSMIAIFPDVNFRISYTLDYPTTNFKTQYGSFLITDESFEADISKSRTFCLEEEVEKLKSLGLGKGASLDNTVVVGKEGIISGSLRFEDEFLRHKVLDVVGDLSLLGCAIKGHVVATKSGHNLNIRLLKEIQKQKDKIHKTIDKEDIESIFSKAILDKEDIKKVLPHRYPFLMVDRIIELSETGAVGLKILTDSDYFFAGHFPGKPVMPGVLMLEALAQVGGVLMLSKEECRGKIAYFMSINNAKFRKIVKPGDELRLEIEVTKLKTKTGQMHGKGFVEGNLVVETDLMFALGSE